VKPKIAVITFLLIFCSAGASLRGAAQENPERPLSKRQVEGLVTGGVYSARIAELVKQRGIDFTPTDDDLRTLRQAGAQEVLIQALRTARIQVPSIARSHAQVLEALSFAGQLEQKKMWPQAESLYRAALNLEPQNVAILLALGRVLNAQGKLESAIEEYRQVIRLQPNLAGPHRELGALLFKTGDVNGAINEYREALRLNANDAGLHGQLAAALYSKGDLEGAITEYRTLARLTPNDPGVHYRLGLALYDEAGLNEAAAEFREALRLKPDLTKAHAALGDALLKEGDRKGALAEYRKSQPGSSDDPALSATFDWLSKQLTP